MHMEQVTPGQLERMRKLGMWIAIHPRGVISGAAFVRRHTRCEPKVALPSPYLLGQRMWDPDRSKSAYSTREEFMWALGPVLRGELEAIRAAGLYDLPNPRGKLIANVGRNGARTCNLAATSRSPEAAYPTGMAAGCSFMYSA